MARQHTPPPSPQPSPPRPVPSDGDLLLLPADSPALAAAIDDLVAWGHRPDWREGLLGPQPATRRAASSGASLPGNGPSSEPFSGSWLAAMGRESCDGDAWMRVSPEELEDMLQGQAPPPPARTPAQVVVALALARAL